MRKRKSATSSMKILCRALQLERPFLFKIPNHTVYYAPMYDWTFMPPQPGDFILFASEHLELASVFLGQIKTAETIGGRGLKELSHFNVDCIKRPCGRGERGMVNQLNKVKIFEKSIVCVLNAVNAINGH
jgi:hypothetical protein